MSKDFARPLCVDLCCGLGGVAEGFLAAGYDVVGYDVANHGYPGKLIVQDVREVDSIVEQWAGREITVLWASPPCQEFTVWDLPWGRNKNLPPPDLSIVNACFELRGRLHPKMFVLENVRGAQPWIGRAPLHRGPYYFWGDVALMPMLLPNHVKGVLYGTFKANGKYVTQHRQRYKESYSGQDPLKRAKIPFELSYGLAMACRGGGINTV